LKAWPILGVLFIQAILLAAHWFIYRTWIDFWFPLGPAAAAALRLAVLPLALSFLAAALVGFRFSNLAIRIFYWLASMWLGVLNYLFLAACLCWPVDFVLRVSGAGFHRPLIAGVLFGLAAVTAVYGFLNAQWIRLRRVVVRLPGLPEAWRGRSAVLLSDLHLGNLNGVGFSRRLVEKVQALHPDIVFMPGDFFDGSGADPEMLAAPFRDLKVPLGMFYVTGNHEEFGDASHYTQAIAGAGIRVLANEKAVVEGLAILGIPYSDSTYPIRVKATLDALRAEAGQPSILLLHAPTRLPIVEQAGVSLQLSGHTHKGQFFPFSWLTRRIFGKFTHGLERFGALQVYTSSGVGTWGPPMRVGTSPEIVEITFE
jgi:predicted MPP superfamily phosphohydrolase